MKRLLFVLVAAFVATTSFAMNVSESVSKAFLGDEATKVEKQKNQPLVLQKAVDLVKSSLSWHYSHSSHSSHSSHISHTSHTSHYSGR